MTFPIILQHYLLSYLGDQRKTRVFLLCFHNEIGYVVEFVPEALHSSCMTSTMLYHITRKLFV